MTAVVNANLLGKLLRFGCVGLVVTGSYSGATYALVAWAAFAPTIASIYGWAVACVVSYLGQKYFTFRSTQGHQIEIPKFAAACTIAFVVTTLSMGIASYAELDYRLSILVTALILPLCNFTVMNLWVFRKTKHSTREPVAKGH